MRLARLYLRNYVGIYNGLGLEEILIDFSKATHSITVIKGDNGSGKSTILKAINPDNEQAKDFVPGKDAVKSISYILPGKVLDITHTSTCSKSGTRSSSCHVRVTYSDGTTKELNPNGNVTEGKKIIHEILGIDEDFLLLAQLSSDDRGLADKNPAERKRFINSKLSQLEFYNLIYKKLVKKSSELKSILNSINSKMDSIGDTESINSSIKSMESSMGDMEDRRNLLIAKIATSKEKLNALADQDNTDILTEYNQLKNELDVCNANFEDCAKYKIRFSRLADNYEAIYASKIARAKSMKENAEEQYKKILALEKELSDRIQTNTIKLDAFGDYAILSDIDERIQECKDKLEFCKEQFSQIGFDKYDDVTRDEYDTAVQFMQRLKSHIQYIRDTYEDNILEETFGMVGSSVAPTDESIEKLRESISESKALIVRQRTLKDQCKTFSLIPDDCNHLSDCPFIEEVVSAKSCLLSEDDFNKLNVALEEQEHALQDMIALQKASGKVMQCKMEVFRFYESIPQTILTKFHGLEWVRDIDSYAKFMLSNQQLMMDTKGYLDRSNLITVVKTTKADMQRFKEQKSSLSKNEAEILFLTESINKDKAAYTAYRHDEEDAKKKIDSYSNEINDLNKGLSVDANLYQTKIQYQNLSKRIDEISDKLPRLKASFTAATTIKETMEADMLELEMINTDFIPKNQDNLQKAKYKIVLYNDYLDQYKKYSSEYDMTEKIKYYASPTTGIQTVYMEMFMNGILSTSNELLKSFFNGEFVLHPFIINEKEFKMPCLGRGIMNDDISSMSTAQVCMISMIVSFALLRSTSNDYSIIKLDEIDGGLDPQNRLQFITVLNTLMKMLSYEQCIMISHNSELSMYDADLIVLKNSDPTLKLDGNVIYHYGGM